MLSNSIIIIPGFFGNKQINDKILHIIQKTNKNKLLITNDTADYAKEEDHFWNLAIRTSPGYGAEDLVIKETLFVEDKNMYDAIVDAVKNNNNLILDPETGNGKIVIQYGAYDEKNSENE